MEAERLCWISTNFLKNIDITSKMSRQVVTFQRSNCWQIRSVPAVCCRKWLRICWCLCVLSRVYFHSRKIPSISSPAPERWILKWRRWQRGGGREGVGGWFDQEKNDQPTHFNLIRWALIQCRLAVVHDNSWKWFLWDLAERVKGQIGSDRVCLRVDPCPLPTSRLLFAADNYKWLLSTPPPEWMNEEVNAKMRLLEP